jgi:hypothetical protein
MFTFRSAIDVWLFGFAVRERFAGIGVTSRLLVGDITIPPKAPRFNTVFPFYIVLDGARAFPDKGLRPAIGGAARFYWWSRPVNWWSGPVYGGAARFYPQDEDGTSSY